ncbi:MAG: YidC/Oxa1 family membrane protein insertase [Clostridium sp.]|nr:YidC/Oxa1 family membrane protein insertase [Clostridium sp.]
MTFFEILYTILIGPLKLLFEIIFELANRFTMHQGLSIIFLSLIMNILVLPLYRRADDMQEQARDIDARLRDGVAHIKKTFSGDEKMMMLQTYYRQNHYKPTDALKGSVSLLLEIPFFIAAYQFLSHLESLNGVSLGPIADLSKPDGMLVIGGFTINLLPVIMTSVNIISSFLYLKGFPTKTKIQLYGMALFFLVFLYGSPSGLVFYWTLNNLFSLVKTIFYKLKNPKKVLLVMLAVIGMPIFVYSAFLYNTPSLRKKVFLILIALILILPLVFNIILSSVTVNKALAKLKKLLAPAPNSKHNEAKPQKDKLFFVGTIFLTVLVGLLIPSNFIAASPQEFVDITYFYNPIWYIVASLAMAAGTFLVWLRVFYLLASPRGRVFFERLVFIMCGLMFADYMFFGTGLGNISSTLQYSSGMIFSRKEQLINLLVLMGIALLMYALILKLYRMAVPVLLVASLALGVMSVVNISTIKSSVDKLVVENVSDDLTFRMSTSGKNVVVIMLDRGMGEYIPYLFNEKPELVEQFAGFTYYPNVVSFGNSTNFGAPTLLGGYEYTPVEMNKRADEPLVAKHNEAIKVMPVLFSDNGYDVTVCDPVYANYQWFSDTSIFNDYPDINACITEGRFSSQQTKQQRIDNNERNFFCFSIMKTMPLLAQPTIYANGTYNQAQSESSGIQTCYNMSKAQGLSSLFMNPYNVLDNMPFMTAVTEENVNTFLYMTNNTTHEPMLLQEPEYVPAEVVDNTKYDAENTARFTVDGRTMKMENYMQMSHYQSNMAALLKLGEWFDFLREQNLYDNTKIIIVSDHGRHLGHFDELAMGGEDNLKNVEMYYPLLLVKEFNSTEFAVSEEFMTTADVPTLAVKDLIDNPINPFTGKAITNTEKTAHEQYIIMSDEYDVAVNNGNAFLPARWARVRENMWNRENWEFYDEEIVLDKYAFPTDTVK